MLRINRLRQTFKMAIMIVTPESLLKDLLGIRGNGAPKARVQEPRTVEKCTEMGSLANNPASMSRRESLGPSRTVEGTHHGHLYWLEARCGCD
jgi:hypothetical protein